MVEEYVQLKLAHARLRTQPKPKFVASKPVEPIEQTYAEIHKETQMRRMLQRFPTLMTAQMSQALQTSKGLPLNRDEESRSTLIRSDTKNESGQGGFTLNLRVSER